MTQLVVTPLSQVETLFKMQRDRSKERLASFVKEFEKNPHHALEWSRAAFEAAARLFVSEALLRAIEGGKVTVETLYKHALDQALRGAQFPPASSSATSNLIAQYTTAAWTDAVESLSSFMK